MSTEAWLFVFAAIQTVCSVFAGLQFFGITSSNLAVPMKGKVWLVVMLFLWFGSLGFTGYGIYQSRERSSEIASLQEDKNRLTSENNDLRGKVTAQTATATQDYRKFPSDKQETISRRKFTNEAVEIDGKIFDHCEFTNVTFIYHGLATHSFIEPRYFGLIQVQTDNMAAKGFMSFATYLRKLPNAEAYWVGEKDESGNARITFKEVRLPNAGDSKQNETKKPPKDSK